MPKDDRRAALWRKTKPELIAMCRAGVTKPGGRAVVIEGGMYPLARWSKADLVSSIMSVEFPGRRSAGEALMSARRNHRSTGPPAASGQLSGHSMPWTGPGPVVPGRGTGPGPVYGQPRACAAAGHGWS